MARASTGLCLSQDALGLPGDIIDAAVALPVVAANAPLQGFGCDLHVSGALNGLT